MKKVYSFTLWYDKFRDSESAIVNNQRDFFNHHRMASLDDVTESSIEPSNDIEYLLSIRNIIILQNITNNRHFYYQEQIDEYLEILE